MVNQLFRGYRNVIFIFTAVIMSSFFMNASNMFSDAFSQNGEKVTIKLYQAQFIPVTDSTDAVEITVNYTLNDPSLYASKINGKMQTYAPDGTLLKTSSYPDGFSITDSGIIFFTTSLKDESIPSVTTNITLTDLEKTVTISNILTTTIPFNDEEGQERLMSKITSSDQELSDALNKRNNQDSNFEVERVPSTSQSDLNITSANSYFEGDFFHIVGEVLNSADNDREFTKVTATLYDDDKSVIGTDYTFTDPTTIPSGESAPFKILIDSNDVDNLNDISSYKITASANK